MVKVNRVVGKSSKRHRINPLGICGSNMLKEVHKKKKQVNTSEKKEWDDAKCSVCLEYPHNAVLLLCSSYHKGCRPYMCATSCRYSNCLEQYKKAYTKVNSTENQVPGDGSVDESNLNLELDCSGKKTEVSELLCPLCRGQVKGWTVVEPPRKYFNKKKRTCMQEKCSFIGTYKDLRKHVKAEHPWARPREVDPTHVEKWKKLESERDQNDVMSTIRSSMPGAVIMGDYVIEGGFSRNRDMSDYLDLGDILFRLETYRGGRNGNSSGGRNGNSSPFGIFERDYDESLEDEDEDVGIRHDHVVGPNSRVLFGSSRQRRRRRTGTGNQ